MAILKPGQLASGSYTISGSFSGSFQGSGAGLNNIPSSAIVGLSSTQIASGAVSASVSTGTGSFTVNSGSSTFMFISSSGRVGIGTNNPSASLDVSGSARFNGNVTVDANAGRLIFRQTAGGNVFNGIDFFSQDAGGNIASLISNQFTGEFRIFNGTSYFPTFYSSNAEAMRIATTQNVLIGTTTDAGFRLDVNGTARVLGQTTLTGTTNNNTTTILRVEQNNGNGRFLVNAAGQTTIVGENFQIDENFVTISRNAFNPTSGVAAHNSLFIAPTINQTGGANLKIFQASMLK